MAALSDYLESGILNHIFRNTTFAKPSTISIALTSGVPLDSDTGSTILEIPSGFLTDGISVDTGYRRINLNSPASNGTNVWENVGVDNTTAYSVSGLKHDQTYGYFYPLYLTPSTAQSQQYSTGYTEYTFNQFPNVIFYAPLGSAPNGSNIFNSGSFIKSSFTEYAGNGFIKNKNQLVFNTALTEWGWISGIAITDNSSVGSGNLLMYAKLSNPRYVYIGDNIRFDANSLEISLN